MSTQTEAKKSSKIEAPRYLPLETVSLRIESESLPDGMYVFGIVSNISKTGACVIANHPIPADALVELDVELAREAKSMTMKARVVWCAERFEPVKEIVGFLSGVSFLDPPEHVEKLLTSGIFQRIPSTIL